MGLRSFYSKFCGNKELLLKNVGPKEVFLEEECLYWILSDDNGDTVIFQTEETARTKPEDSDTGWHVY